MIGDKEGPWSGILIGIHELWMDLLEIHKSIQFLPVETYILILTVHSNVSCIMCRISNSITCSALILSGSITRNSAHIVDGEHFVNRQHCIVSSFCPLDRWAWHPTYITGQGNIATFSDCFDTWSNNSIWSNCNEEM